MKEKIDLLMTDKATQKLYKAEDDSIIGKYKTNNFFNFFNKVIQSKKFKKKYGHLNLELNIYIADDDSEGSHCFFYTDTIRCISIDKSHRYDKAVILHELAHAVQPDIYKAYKHNADFCKDYLWLVYNFINYNAYVKLIKHMDINKVKYRVINENSMPIGYPRKT